MFLRNRERCAWRCKSLPFHDCRAELGDSTKKEPENLLLKFIARVCTALHGTALEPKEQPKRCLAGGLSLKNITQGCIQCDIQYTATWSFPTARRLSCKTSCKTRPTLIPFPTQQASSFVMVAGARQQVENVCCGHDEVAIRVSCVGEDL